MTAEGRRRALARQVQRATATLPDYALELVRFAAIYQGAFPYVCPSWPTSDGIIPARLFRVLYYRLGVAMAFQRLSAARSQGVALQLLSKERPAAELALAWPEGEPPDA